MNIKKSIVTRVRVAFLAVFLFACAVVYRIAHIQFTEGERWQKIAKESRITYQPVFATRGNIFSDNESILATSLPFYRVAFDPTIPDDKVFNQGLDSLALLLSRFYNDKSAEYYRRKIKNARLSGRQYVRLNSRLINYQDKKQMMNWPVFRQGKLKGGVIFEKVDKRFRPFGYLAQRTIGFINEDKRGAGLEYSFNHMLAGKDGEALFERMAGGNKPIYDGTEVKPQPGYDIKTTIDINLQDVAENALHKALVTNNAEYGCVVLMEVKTGEIKAIANLGKFDEGVYAEDYNYAVGNQGRTEPGSTIKLASMMALFEASNVQLSDSIETGNGRYRFPGATMTDAKDGGYGKLTVQEVFEKSSNIGISKLIVEHFGSNPQLFVDYLNRFGLGKTLDFQMEGEAKPYIKNPKDRSWSRTTLPWMSIGYELKLSPLQTLAFYNAVANNGVKVQPIIVKEIRKADKVIERYQTTVLNEKICSDETLKKLRLMLEGVVENGTGKKVKSSDYKVAGKTGTAQKIKNGHYTKTYSTSFVGYFPADNPKYTCIVVIDSPKSYNQYGGDVAAPVFRELADKAYARDLESHRPIEERITAAPKGMPVVKAGYQEDLTLLCNKLGISAHPATVDEDWVKADSQNQALFFKPNPVMAGEVPDVVGMGLRDALYILGNQGLKVKVIGSGRVKQQSLQPGTACKKGNQIVIVLS
ncbi:MAG: transpeptidase family protein [Hymenobacteraceae bacterium]|nr:transpeptidase family protein [Hymenobacteraceae bacterium]MDX5396691.1 transpeptidase family protein [Hymenobacteraceae bacterium]MDX5442509.1 transpeptidase family protein [Hymenobacteraceae bacterium]MDX5512751.1 transpeptidase family protein [Hymenobacteraceae bacterium]